MRKDIIVIGASTGGVDALKRVVGELPNDLAASVFIVLHTSPESPGLLAEILGRVGRLPTLTVETSERIRDKTVYVARPDYHLLIEPGTVRSAKGPKENRFRPAIDPLFRSAAQTYGPRVIGVVLTGALDDGTAGLWAVKHLGGTAIVQDPQEATAPSMPLNAMRHVAVDYCLPLSEIAAVLGELSSDASSEVEGGMPVPKWMKIEVDIANARNALEAGVLELGKPSNLTCPECHGVLLGWKEDNRTRFRCHTGHAYSAETLLAEINEAVEDALWNSIRAMEEHAFLIRDLASQPAHEHDRELAARLEAWLERVQRRADLVRQAVFEYSSPPPDSK